MTIPPAKLGGFEIIRRLASGGMAEVFVARKIGAEGIAKVLVVKRILGGQNRRFRRMFIEEAQLATRLNHPNIVQVYELLDGGEQGLLLAMEYVEGVDLGQLAKKARAKDVPIPPWVAAHIVAETAKGLHYAHERKEGGAPLEIVHRDVSPQNILLSYEGATKIADFGIASANLFHEDIGTIQGKYGYMSPEQARGERVDRRSDIYALGVVLHELLTSRPLYGKLRGERLLNAVRAAYVEPPSTFARDIPAELEAIAMRALSPAREERFQTARDFASAVMRALLERQQLVDASAVEALIQQLVSRESIPSSKASSRPHASPASVAPLSPSRAEAPEIFSKQAPITQAKRNGTRFPREVRHVVLVSLRLHGLDDLDKAIGGQAAIVAADKVRATLEDIAYKRGAHWTWDSKGSARATVGLLSNPARAAADSAYLALDVHEALATAYEDLAVPIQASIGLVRAVARGERDPDGHLVRHSLQGSAEEMALLVGQRTPVGMSWATGGLYRLVRRELRWADAPTLELRPDPKGQMPSSMRLYSLERALTRQERMAELALAPSALVGREAEKADLHSAYHRAVRDSGSIVARVVVGEMGIGKTALVSAFLSELPKEARVVRVECSPSRANILYGDIAELARAMIGAKPKQAADEVALRVREQIEPVTKARAPAIAAAIAELISGQQLRETEDEDVQYRKRLIHSGMRAMIASIASQRPLVIVIDALQWSNRSALELIGRLLARQAPLPILALFVTRPDERTFPFLEGLLRIELGGLSADEQMRLVEAHLGVEEGVRELCSDMVAKVAGNPFFLLEMVDALLEKGSFEIREDEEGKQILVRVERGREDEEALPSTLEQLIGDRLRELPEDELAIVEWLAVAGGPLAKASLIALSGLKTQDSINRLLLRGLCEEEGSLLDFRHPLTRDVAYLGVSPDSRKRMHRELGEHLAETPIARGMSAAMVAPHFEKGGEQLRAAELYLEAASAARVALQPLDAVRYFQRSLGLLPPDDTKRMVAHEGLEAIYRVLGRKRLRRQHLASLRSLARKYQQPHWVALALLRTARQSLDDGFLAAGIPYAEKAERVAKAADAPRLLIQAQALLSELLREAGDFQSALAACERALATASNPVVSQRLRGDALRTRGVLLRRVGRVAEAIECHAQAIAIFRKTGAKRLEARAKNSLSYAMFVLERYEDAISLALDSIAIDLSIGGRFQLAKTTSNIGYAYARLGDIPRALVYLDRARDLHERYNDQDARADTLLVSAEVLIQEGHLDTAHAFLSDAGALNAVTKNAYDIVHERIVRARFAKAIGDYASAAAHALAGREKAEGRTLVSFTLFAMAIEAASRVAMGEIEEGTRLALTALETALSMEGTEFGIEVRALCAEALRGASSREARRAQAQAAAHVLRVAETIRNPRLRRLFLARPLVSTLLSQASPGGERGVDA